MSLLFLRSCLKAAVLTLALPVMSIHAEERQRLTGDWFGHRSRLENKGVSFDFAYTGEMISNLSGGIRKTTQYNGLAEASVDLELDALFGWDRGPWLHVSALSIQGNGATDTAIGDLQTASNIEGHNSTRLYEWFVAHEFMGGGLRLQLGMQLADEEFGVLEYGDIFMNSSFGWPAWAAMNAYNGGPAFFVPALGAFLQYDLSNTVYAKVAVYDGDSLDDPNGGFETTESGTHIELGNGQGALAIAETGYAPAETFSSLPLPGFFKLGFWFHTRDAADADGVSNHDHNYGAYISMEQMIWKESPGIEEDEQGLRALARTSWSPEDRNPMEWELETGLTWQGMIPRRDNDRFGVGIACVDLSSDARRVQKIAGDPFPQDYELVLETTYEAAITPWLTVQPGLQWIHQPGGSDALTDAWVFILRGSLSF